MIKATHWPKEITKFVLNESNSRSVPGKEQVSVRYGFHLPNCIILCSRKDIALSFKEIHPDCPFLVPTIMREFPQNTVTPITCDLERSTCPVHANACRLNNAINRANKKSLTDTLPSSCSDLICLSICNTANIIPADPLSWNKGCVNGVYKSCPKNQPINVTPELGKKIIKKSGKVVSVAKKVLSLYPHSCDVKEALAMLKNMCKQLRKHIYTAHMQWNAHVQ